jgi:Tol biopolymer transport system component
MGNPHWSPDGRLITFSSNWRIGHQIYVVEVATGKDRRISGLTGGGCEPRFGRDGGKVVYVSRGHLRPTSRLVEHDLASGEERALVSWPALNYDPVYSPDGTELASPRTSRASTRSTAAALRRPGLAGDPVRRARSPEQATDPR